MRLVVRGVQPPRLLSVLKIVSRGQEAMMRKAVVSTVVSSPITVYAAGLNHKG